MSAQFSEIQDAAVAQIAAQPFFTGGGVNGAAVPVIAENKRDIETEIEVMIAKLGCAAVVSIGNAPVKFPDIPGPRYEGASLLVVAYENVTINRGSGGANKTALSIAEQAAAALHLITLPIEGISVCVCKSIEAADAAEGEVAYVARFEFSAGGGDSDPEIPLVVWADSVLDAGFVPAEQTHTIDCGTP